MSKSYLNVFFLQIRFNRLSHLEFVHSLIDQMRFEERIHGCNTKMQPHSNNKNSQLMKKTNHNLRTDRRLTKNLIGDRSLMKVDV